MKKKSIVFLGCLCANAFGAGRFSYPDFIVPNAAPGMVGVEYLKAEVGGNTTNDQGRSQSGDSLHFVDWAWDQSRCNVVIASVITEGSVVNSAITLGANVGNLDITCW